MYVQNVKSNIILESQIKMNKDMPVFEICDPNKKFNYKIFANGKIEGFPPSIVINRIPLLINDLLMHQIK